MKFLFSNVAIAASLKASYRVSLRETLIQQQNFSYRVSLRETRIQQQKLSYRVSLRKNSYSATEALLQGESA